MRIASYRNIPAKDAQTETRKLETLDKPRLRDSLQNKCPITGFLNLKFKVKIRVKNCSGLKETTEL